MGEHGHDDGNGPGKLRAAFLIVSPPVYIGAWILYLARRHLDEDTMKIFQAVLRAMEQDQERAAARGPQSAAPVESADHDAD